MDSPTLTALVVDDDDRARADVVDGLVDHFDRILEAPSAELALYACGAHSVDVVATSAALPGMGAQALCTELVGHGGPPIVAYGLPRSGLRRARWLDEGCADCMTGREPNLVAARCRAVVRRTRRLGGRRGSIRSTAPKVIPGLMRWR